MKYIFPENQDYLNKFVKIHYDLYSLIYVYLIPAI